jgi:hypothetical protein
MSKSYRIRTTPGGDNGYLKVNVDLKQDYDHLEILSLKISQIDEYQNYCSDYGVIAGRVDINNGFGVPNVKVSIFVPVEDIDLSDPVISKLYPYEDPFPDKKNINGIRYNILPKNKQTLDHTPVGTFPKKREILDDATTLEMYEKYYKFTTTTNKSGDYILFGVPLGNHYLHYDCDVSDIGFISSRPYEMMSEGYSEELFRNRFKFKSDNNLDSLAQIFSQNIPIRVEPFWCDSLSVGSPIGINRLDFSIGYEVTPTAIFMGSIFSDDENDSLNKNCKPGKQMGKMNEVITGGGVIESIRRNVRGGIETFSFKDNTIDENGNWSVLVPMNIRKVVTDEFGNLVPSPDGIKGIATEGDYRFRISMDASDTDKRLRQRAKFLVPNTNNNFNFGEYSTEELKTSTDFTINEQLSTITDGTQYENDLTNQYNYIEEFYPFRWKKVYTVKQYIGRMQKAGGNDEARGFIGIKDVINSEGVNKFPSNRFDTSIHPLYAVICILLSFVGHLIGFVNGILMMFNGLITEICQFTFPVKISFQYCFRITSLAICNDTYIAKGNTGDCNNCQNNSLNDKEAEFIVSIGWKCLFGGLICKDCQTLCDDQGRDGFMGNAGDIPFRCCGWFKADGSSSANAFDFPCQNNDQSGSSPCTAGVMGNPAYLYTYKNCSTKWDLYSGSNCGDGSPTGLDFLGKSCGDGTVTFRRPLDGPPNRMCCPWCCIKIPLIPLKCKEEGIDDSITILTSPFGPTDCNRKYAKPGGCVNCGGYQTQVIKDWVACLLEPVAVFLKMLKFDFYNDWVGGSLYFPLIKRKYKLKKRKKKFGQIKKDKFCDFECKDGDTLNFQGDSSFTQWRIKISDVVGIINPTIEVEGCIAKVKGKSVSNWYGSDDNDDQTFNLNLASKEIKFLGRNSNSDPCIIGFETWADIISTFTPTNIVVEDESKEVATEHGKPEYVETDDGFGNSTWTNIGGHSHHKNMCDETNMVERKEFFKTTLDCLGPLSSADTPPGAALIEGLTTRYKTLPCDPIPFGSTGVNPDWQFCLDNPKEATIGNNFETFGSNSLGFCIAGCDPDCGSNGVAPCKKTNMDPINNYNYKTIKHGLITWNDEQIYYTPRMIKNGDPKFNNSEYKGNLLLPTTILELGSSVYCDIDDVPFIMDQLPPTTFAAAFEDMTYKLGNTNPYTDNTVDPTDPNAKLTKILQYSDKKDSPLNLRAYVEFSCISVVCANTSAAVNQSQLGVEIIDKNDIGIEIGNCFVRFDHDADLREYFCKRFNGYQRRTNKSLSFHHTRPGSMEFDNEYNTYPEITLTEGYNHWYETPENPSRFIKSEYNDGDSFIPGDGCGYRSKDNDHPNNKTDYFYGLAPGQTSGFINYPNYDTDDGAAGTINFGSTAQNDGTDEIFSASSTNSNQYVDDDNNGSVGVKGIRHNRSQTPYFLYFGLVPGKTALHKSVGKFFADKINATTLQGVGASNDDVSQNIMNRPNVNNEEDNPFTVFRTCLGDTLIQKVQVGVPTSNSLVPNTLTPSYPNTDTGILPRSCASTGGGYYGNLEINNTLTPINLYINGGTLPTNGTNGTTGWLIQFYDTSFNLIPSSDVTMSDSTGNIYPTYQLIEFVTGVDADIEITFSNYGTYVVVIIVTNCVGSNSDGYVTISV